MPYIESCGDNAPLDSVDVRVFCEMAFRNPRYHELGDRRPSLAEIGKKLRLDEKTVRARVSRMEDSGFIKYYQASPNLGLFGMHTVSLYRFEALNLSTKFAVIEGLGGVPRLVESSDYLGPYLTASIAGATHEETKREADGLTNRFELSTVYLGSTSVRQVPAHLDGLDWQIVKGLRYDARTSDKDLAARLAVTVRMVGYRVSKLLNSGAIEIRAVINPQKQAGLVFYELEVFTHPRRQEQVSRWLSRHFGDRLWSLVSRPGGVILASLFCFSIAEPEASVIEVGREDGVARCLLFVLKEVIEPGKPNWVDSLIELRIGNA